MTATTDQGTKPVSLHRVISAVREYIAARRPDPRWRRATTIADLADVTADWLTGDVRSQPGYYGPCDVDDAPDLRDALIALNDAGYLTVSSQQGYDGPGYRGSVCLQNAAVEGLADPTTIERLLTALRATGVAFEYEAHPVGNSREYARPVTFIDGTFCTSFGSVRRSDIRTIFDGCPDAWPACYAATVFTILAPRAGTNDLWAALLTAARSLNEVTA